MGWFMFSLHYRIDSFRGGHAFHHGEGGFVDHWQENAIGHGSRGIVSRQTGIFSRRSHSAIVA